MRKLLITILMSTVCSMLSAQELWTSNVDINLPNHISLKEIADVKHAFKDGEGKVTITKLNGTEYELSALGLRRMDVESKASAFLNDGRYVNMRWTEDIDNLQNLENGTLLGVFSEDDFSGDDFITAAYLELRADPGASSLCDAMENFMSLNLTSLALDKSMLKSNIRVHRASIAYVSTDIDGSKIVLTGNLLYPYNPKKSKHLECNNVYIDNHLTIFNDAKAPSQIMSSGAMLQGICTKGYLVVQPDLIGIGATKTRTQQYVDKNINPSHIVDCVFAALQYQDFSKNSPMPLAIASDATTIVSGGSQGATSALATTYYIENVLSAERRAMLPAIKETHLCAGAYDMKLTLNTYCKENRVVFSPIVPLLMQGVFSAHSDLMVDENGKPYSLHDFFVPELRTRKWDTTPYGLPGEHTLWQMLDSKGLESPPLVAALTEVCGVLDESIIKLGCYSEISRMLNKDILKDNGDGSFSLNEQNPKVKAFSAVLEQNDLTNPELWVPKSDIYMIHGVDDYMVPYANSKQMYDNMHKKMKLRGHNIRLKTLDDCNSLGNHIIICGIWALSEISGLDFDTIAKMM